MLVDGGINDGDVYEYIGPDGADRLRLEAGQSVGDKDLRNTDLWRQINLNPQASSVTAKVVDTSIDAQGTLSITALSNQTVDSEVFAGSVAVGAGQVGVGVSGAGVSTQNKINTNVEASITGDGSGITVGAVDIDATDSSTIKASAGAASIAAGFGQVGVSVSLGVAIASNDIDNTIRAFITGADDGISAVKGDIDVHASDNSTMNVDAVAASLAVSGGMVGVALAGAGAIAENVIGNEVEAFIDAGSIVEAAARFNYYSTDTLSGTIADPPGINPGERVAIVNTLQDSPADFTTSDTPALIVTNQIVALDTDIAGGNEGLAGQKYVYVGSVDLSHPDLGSINYVTNNDWRLFVPAATAGQIYEYIGNSPLLPVDPSVPVINLDEIIYANSEVIAVPITPTPNPSDPLDPANFELVPGWRLLEFGANQNVNVSASNTSSINTLVGGVAAAISGGAVAVSGSVGVAIGRNLIGTGDAGAQVTNAYIEDSQVIASGDITINANASETIEADVFAGSVAIAVGIGAAVAGAGAELSNSVSSDVQAFALNSDLAAIDDIDVIATSSTQIDKAQSLGVAVSGSLGAASVAVSLVDNTISNDVDAYISSTGAANQIMADGDLSILADVTNARIVAAAETASVSVGLVGLSGGGINITNLVSNTVDAI